MPIDVEQHISYWQDGAVEALAGAEVLVAGGKYTFGLFFMHLAVEKSLKALVVRATGDIPPRTHDLLHLAHLAQVELSPERAATIARFTLYNLEGRYPQATVSSPDHEEAIEELAVTKEMLRWLQPK